MQNQPEERRNDNGYAAVPSPLWGFPLQALLGFSTKKRVVRIIAIRTTLTFYNW